jgi:outer membrane protein OmpA-like peptidoglycan-associated protein/Tol biopolymer transport system component
MKKSFSILLFLTVACYIFNFSGQAQNVDFIASNFPEDPQGFNVAMRNLQQGNNHFTLGETMYPQALRFFLLANNFNSNNAILNYRIGICYYTDENFDNAISYLEKARSLNVNENKLHFYLGRLYHMTHEFEKGLEHYNAYKTSLGNDFNPEEGAKIERFIAQCKTGAELKRKPVNITIENIGRAINSRYPEYNPIISPDGNTLYFTSRRPNTTGGGKDPNDKQYYEDIYITYREGNSWKTPENPRFPLNSRTHDATAGISADGQILFVYRGSLGGNIFTSQRRDGQWTPPIRLNKNINTNSQETSASMTADGQILYFISNRPGGVGGKDVYMSVKDEKGDWGPASLIPGKVNTIYDEENAFISPDGKTLYFSSEGHNTMGGFDIFKSTLENGQWTSPVNLGYPINTARDDVFFTISENGHRGYYASAHFQGYGDTDIYEISFVDIIKEDIIASDEKKDSIIAELMKENITDISGKVLDKETKLPVNAKIIVNDRETGELITSLNTGIGGNYNIKLLPGKHYEITATAEGYVYHYETLNLLGVDGYQQMGKDIYMNKIATVFALDQGIRLANIYFDFNKSTLRPESFNELKKLVQFLSDNPSMKVEISGHTDNIGSAEYNKKLSTNRAKVVVDYLVSKGISSARLSYQGYGFDKPVATNDTDEGRQLNRRTEFKIIQQ